MTGGPSDLPTYFTRFVGREDELRHLRALLDQAFRGSAPDARIVTLVGEGGIGKTRLAYEVARGLEGQPVDDRPLDAVWWIDLTAVTDAGGLEESLALACGISPSGARERPRSGRLRKRALLVLDGCEHLDGAYVAITRDLLAGCPDLVVLATRRRSLGHGPRMTLAPLGTGEGDAGGWRSALDLFRDRAGLNTPGVDPAADDDTVRALCRRLGGLPLAIELAAPWIRALSTGDPVRSLDARLEPRAATPLQAALDLTWSSLAAEDREVLTRLGVFTGTFGLEAAEQVAGATLPTLSSLTARALVRRVPGVGDRTRYLLHEIVRDDARDRLAARPGDASASTWIRNGRYYADLVDRSSTGGSGERAGRERLREDRANILAALAREARAGRSGSALRMLAGLLGPWPHDGALLRHLPLIAEVLGLRWDPTDPVVAGHRARCVEAAGWAEVSAARLDRAVAWFDEALVLAQRLADVQQEAGILRALARVAELDKRQVDAKGLALRSLAVSRRAGDAVGAGWSHTLLARAASSQARWTEARQHADAALTTFTSHAVADGQLTAMSLRAPLLANRRQWPEALEDLRRSTLLIRTSGITTTGRAVAEGVAEVAHAFRRFACAARLYGAAAAWDATYGGEPWLTAEDHRLQTRQALSDQAWAQAYASGVELDPDDILVCVERALADLAAEVAASATGLTAREREVLSLLSEGLTNDQMARRMEVSSRTVHAHLRSIYTKLGVSSRTAAVHTAAQLLDHA